MVARSLVGGLVCAMLVGLAYALGAVAPETAHRATALQGERWYTLGLDGRQVGYLHSRAFRDHAGNWQFTTDMRFVLAPGQPVAVLDGLIFDADPPYELIQARHENRRRGERRQVSIERTPEGYHAQVIGSGAVATAHSASLEWAFSMEDYLAFERWLHAQQPRIGASRTVPTLDLERLQVVNKNHRVIDLNSVGYTVENAALHNPTRIQLDADYAPISLEMAGLFSLARTSRARALAPRTALQSGSYYIPTNEALVDHANIQRLVLRVTGSDRPTDIWPQLEHTNEGWRLELQANPLSGAKQHADTGATSAFPSASLQIRRLARQAVGDATDTATKVARLVDFVHQYITYQPGASQDSVLALLENPRGDCTEFADLFSTLARALDIPARTVFGLAYASRTQPAFAFHAWNEVSVDGTWKAVDPTWNQLRVDATHIPLPASDATLRLITGADDLRFNIEEVEYFNP